MQRLIDADKLRKDVLDLPNCYNGFSDVYDKALIIDLVDEQPTVDAEPVRHGRWETVFMSEATGYDPTLANYIDTVFCHRCSVCKEDARLDEFGEEVISKYCPNCGAKMDEVEDAEIN